MIPLAICLFFGFVVGFTGPAFDEERKVVFGILNGFLERRQHKLDAPKARGSVSAFRQLPANSNQRLVSRTRLRDLPVPATSVVAAS